MIPVNQQARKISLLDHFLDLPDPRIDRNKKHSLTAIVTIAICAVIGNANDWNEIEIWAVAKEGWLKGFLALPNGIPSHDTFNRVFSLIDPQAFLNCFSSWIKAISSTLEDSIIAIDGKTVERH